MSAKQDHQGTEVIEAASYRQNTSASHAPQLQQQESDAVRRYMLLELALLIIDHDIKAIGLSKFKLPRLYETVLRGVQDRVLLDMAELRKMFRKGGIKIYNKLRREDGLQLQYVCRGYHYEKFMLWTVIKVECEVLLKRYMSQ